MRLLAEDEHSTLEDIRVKRKKKTKNTLMASASYFHNKKLSPDKINALFA